MIEAGGFFCASAVLAGKADFLIQCAVHPATMATVAKYLEGLYVVDTFISPSQDLAIIQRKGAVQPGTLAVMKPTLDYTDASRWDKIEYVATVAEVSKGLVEGKYDYLPEAAFYMVGTIEEAVERGKKLAAEVG